MHTDQGPTPSRRFLNLRNIESTYRFRARNAMVRPKASDRNKKIASYFADTITVEQPKSRPNVDQNLSSFVYYKGPHSIYEALVICLPTIVRESRDKACSNRKGITEVELNKALVARGYESSRQRVFNGSTWAWRRGWYGRRWVNGDNPEDVDHVKVGIRALQHFPEARSLTLDAIFRVVSSLASNPTQDIECFSKVWHDCPTPQPTLCE